MFDSFFISIKKSVLYLGQILDANIIQSSNEEPISVDGKIDEDLQQLEDNSIDIPIAIEKSESRDIPITIQRITDDTKTKEIPILIEDSKERLKEGKRLYFIYIFF